MACILLSAVPLRSPFGREQGGIAARETVMGPNVRTYLFHSLGGVIGPSFSVAQVKEFDDGWSI